MRVMEMNEIDKRFITELFIMFCIPVGVSGFLFFIFNINFLLLFICSVLWVFFWEALFCYGYEEDLKKG